MLRKLTTKSTVNRMDVEERTAQMTCDFACKRQCAPFIDPEMDFTIFETAYQYL